MKLQGKEIAIASTPAASNSSIARAGLVAVELEHHRALPIDALADLANLCPWHDRVRLLMARDVAQLANRQAGRAPDRAHDQQSVGVAARCDQSGSGALHLDNRVGADGGAVKQQRGVREQSAERHPSRSAATSSALKKPRAKSSGVESAFGDRHAPVLVHHDTIGEGAAGID